MTKIRYDNQYRDSNLDQEKVIEKLREEAKKLPSRLIHGTRKRDFPNATPRGLLSKEATSKKRKQEEWEDVVKKK